MASKLLKLGSTGGDVLKLQIALGVEPTNGVFDQNTDAAVRHFQKALKLTVDGIVGDQTFAALLLGAKGIITEAAFAECANDLKIEVACIKAFAEVESSGNGFLRDGRAKIKYERHWAYKLFNRKGNDADGLVRFMPELVNPDPGGYLNGLGDWLKFSTLSLIDRSIAIQCCSWGTFQVMGFHYERLGFKNPEAFYAFIDKDANCHLELLTTFIKTDLKLHNALQKKDFATVATIYNGTGHVNYDQKMIAAYKRHA